ncbi:hypothetical protein [Bacillus cereus group sp. BfR-BA-01318]|uniref:hypothetical protein n=1 Tax=Bacillus cereus group sp. BfR-BA-01318 TaxID=2920295 RepID=UPI001F58F668|nr:hypothetical protein [Bacillus cereus group sp. BfR-BA-01318]
MENKKTISEEVIEHIISLREQGMSIRSIEKEVKVERHKISKLLKQRNMSTMNLSNHTYYEDVFDKIDTEEKAYWLGLLFADGHISEYKSITALTLQNSDKDHLKKFAKFIGVDAKVSKHSENASRVSISNKRIYDALFLKGCVNNKSLILEFPKYLSDKHVRHFIRGYYDGDGGPHIGTQKNGKTKDLLFHVTGTFSFIREIQNILDIDNKLSQESKLGNVFTLRVKGNQKPLRILDWLYKDATIFLQRKYDIYQEFKSIKSEANAVQQGSGEPIGL